MLDPASIMAIGWTARWLHGKLSGGRPPACGMPGCSDPAAEVTNCCDAPFCAYHARVYKEDRAALGRCPIPQCRR